MCEYCEPDTTGRVQEIIVQDVIARRKCFEDKIYGSFYEIYTINDLYADDTRVIKFNCCPMCGKELTPIEVPF